jgi:hypothetical protein
VPAVVLSTDATSTGATSFVSNKGSSLKWGRDVMAVVTWFRRTASAGGAAFEMGGLVSHITPSEIAAIAVRTTAIIDNHCFFIGTSSF